MKIENSVHESVKVQISILIMLLSAIEHDDTIYFFANLFSHFLTLQPKVKIEINKQSVTMYVCIVYTGALE